MRGDAARSLPHAEALLGLCREHNIQSWAPTAGLVYGWARWHLGEREAGMAGMRQGAALFRQARVGVYIPFVGLALGEAQAQSDGPEAGLATLDETLAENERTGQRWLDAELHRQRGQILLQGRLADTTAAEAAFTRAMEVAHGQQTKVFELRAALSLAKLYDATGRGKMAREVLAPILAAFDKGQELPEIDEAKRLGA